METTYIKEFPGTPFSIEVSTVENSPGTWNSSQVVICREDSSLKAIGEYRRNYPNYSRETFYPFKAVDGNWYALYSAHYTATRVMRLHEDRIEDWCGEDPASSGFCPTEIYVPQYHTFKSSYKHGDETKEFDYYLVDNECDKEEDFFKEDAGKISTDYCKFGFLCGCVWGDDTSWKLRYIDLSEVPNKKLTISDKFGYWQLPTDLKLKQCINMRNWEPNHSWVELTRMEHVNLETGERC